MKITFLGANRQVTGSRYCIESEGVRVMIDCGLFQERNFVDRNWRDCPIPAHQVSALLLTHIHIDHCGLLPRFVSQGFHGPIYCTRPTAAFARIMLMDAARIQMEDASYKKKRHQKENRTTKFPEVPLFTDKDVEATLPLFQSVAYGVPQPINDRMHVTFLDAGHILGSAILQVDVHERGKMKRIIFSGDLGQWDKPLVRDPTLVSDGDYVILESTYGDRNHEASGDVVSNLADVINRTISRGGNVVIPTFAVERVQELMYHISALAFAKRIPEVPVYVDSPMAVDITAIYRQFPDCFDEHTWKRMASNDPPFHFPGLRLSRTVEESKAINQDRTPSIIMATSGMCTSGRIKHHLKHNLERRESTILFVGYQAENTLGRIILNRVPRVRIHGKESQVRAEISQLMGFSAHADQQGLLRWASALNQPRRIFLTHGEEQAALHLQSLIQEKFQHQVSVPRYEDVFEL